MLYVYFMQLICWFLLIIYFVFYVFVFWLGSSQIMIIEPMWVNTSELASSFMPDGELSNTVCDIGISILQDTCPNNKVIFPYLVTKYLMEGNFNSNMVRRSFRRDDKYKLSHKDLVCYCLFLFFIFFCY
jgi:hypothetical protein